MNRQAVTCADAAVRGGGGGGRRPGGGWEGKKDLRPDFDEEDDEDEDDDEENEENDDDIDSWWHSGNDPDMGHFLRHCGTDVASNVDIVKFSVPGLWVTGLL